MSKRTSPSSGRSIELDVTPHGAAMIASILERRRDELSDALGKIPAEERDALRQALSLIAETIGEPR